MQRWLIRFWAALGGAVVLALLVSALFGADGVTRHERLKKELGHVNALNAQLASDNKKLAVKAKALRRDPKYIEQAIRDELGWVKRDEIVLIFSEAR